MDGKVTPVQDIFLEKINRICRDFGLNNIMAQLYAILYFNGRPLSLDEMAEKLQISKGSVSINIRALERYGAVRRSWVKGSRKDFYEAESDISKVILERIRSMAQRRLSELGDTLDSSYRAIDAVECEPEDEDVKIFRQRLDALKALHEKARSAFKIFNSGLLVNGLEGEFQNEPR